MWKKNKSMGIGVPKETVRESYSLGDKGYIVVGLTYGVRDKDRVVCFRDVDGPDFLVHEAAGDNISAEKILVEVTPDKNPKTENWYTVGIAATNKENMGWIPFDIGHVGLKVAYWIKISDLESQKSSKVPGSAGFDLSTVVLKKPCKPQPTFSGTYTLNGLI